MKINLKALPEQHGVVVKGRKWMVSVTGLGTEIHFLILSLSWARSRSLANKPRITDDFEELRGLMWQMEGARPENREKLIREIKNAFFIHKVMQRPNDTDEGNSGSKMPVTTPKTGIGLDTTT